MHIRWAEPTLRIAGLMAGALSKGEGYEFSL